MENYIYNFIMLLLIIFLKRNWKKWGLYLQYANYDRGRVKIYKCVSGVVLFLSSNLKKFHLFRFEIIF